MPPDKRLQGLLSKWRSGDRSAVGELFSLLYDDLHAIARRAQRAKRLSETLRATVLVDELYLRLNRQRRVPEDRGHLKALSTILINQIVREELKKRNRKSWCSRITFDESLLDGQGGLESDGRVLDALGAMESKLPRVHEMVCLRYWGGMENREIADFMGLSVRTVEREIRVGKAFLRRTLERDAQAERRERV